MPRAEFEEKEFEQAAGVELAQDSLGRRGVVLSSGQVLERIVGYDAATAPARRHQIWELLNVSRPPGIKLVPEFWEPARQPPKERLPGIPVSLVLQFKRPEYLYGRRARQWMMWQQPFFRFARTGHQHRVLLRLERRLGRNALVRYGAPAFWRRGELEEAHLRREVLARTGFAAPSDFGRHRVWTYIAPGTDGRGNPGGRRKPFLAIEELFGLLNMQPVGTTDVVHIRALDEHVLLMGAVATEGEPQLRAALSRWATRLRQADLALSPRSQALVVALAAVATLTSVVGATWRVLFRTSADR